MPDHNKSLNNRFNVKGWMAKIENGAKVIYETKKWEKKNVKSRQDKAAFNIEILDINCLK